MMAGLPFWDDGSLPKLHWDSIARRYVEHDTVPQETFGPLTDWPFGVAGSNGDRHGNDNVPVASQPARDSIAKFPKIMAALREQEQIDSLRDIPGFIYLGSPYSKYELGHDVAAFVVTLAAARLMATGLRIYCPITHGHFISKHGKLPQTWEFWQAQCQPMIDAASSLIVLQMDGWEESVGLIYEIGEFERTGRPIVYVRPDELAGGRMAA